MKMFKIADFTATIPPGAEQYIGTSSVEASQITSAFGRSHEAINWVNRYKSDLLKNIAFILGAMFFIGDRIIKKLIIMNYFILQN